MSMTSLRLVVRRIRREPPPGQDELLPTWRYHAFLTDTGLSTVDADLTHRAHAIIEQVFADLIDGPPAHLPSGRFAANGAWLTCAAIAHNLLRATATLTIPKDSPTPRGAGPGSSAGAGHAQRHTFLAAVANL